MRSIVAYLCLCPANFRAKIDAGSISSFLLMGSIPNLTPLPFQYTRYAEEPRNIC